MALWACRHHFVTVTLITMMANVANMHFVELSPVSVADVLQSINQCAESLSVKTSSCVDVSLVGLIHRPVENHTVEAIMEKLSSTKIAFGRIASFNSEDTRSFSKQVELLKCSTQIFTKLLEGNASTVPKSLPFVFLEWHTVYMYYLQKILGGAIMDRNFILGYYWDANSWPGINPNITTIDQILQISNNSHMFNPDAVIEKMRRMSTAGPVYRAGIDVQGDLAGMLLNTTLSLAQEPGPVDPNRFLHHGMIDRIWTHLLLQNGNHKFDPQVMNVTLVLFDETGTKVNVKIVDP